MSVRVYEVEVAQRPSVGARIREMERGIDYPFGTDRFEIDHGPDYFAFFDRLGETAMFVAEVDGEIVGAATGVLRTIQRPSGKWSDAWYCCDLKVAPTHRGQRLPLRMLMRGLATKYRTCRRGYGIAMRSPDGRRPPIVRLASHIGVIGSTVGEELSIYSLSASEMEQHAATIARHRGELSFLSLSGRKDIILRSTGRPMNIAHLQFGPCASPAASSALLSGHQHMFCSPVSDPLTRALTDLGVTPSASANIIHHGMASWDWSFVLTSDL